MNETSVFFFTLQLTCNIRLFKISFQNVEESSRFCIFCGSLQIWAVWKFEKNWRQKFSFHNFCTSFCPWLMQYEVLFNKILGCVTFHCVLCYITLHYKFNSHQFTYRSKQHTQKMCIFNKKNFFFNWRYNDHSKRLQRKKLIGLQNLEEPSIQKWDYFFVEHLLRKFKETRSLDRRLGSGWPRTVSREENIDLIEEFIFSQEQQLHMH